MQQSRGVGARINSYEVYTRCRGMNKVRVWRILFDIFTYVCMYVSTCMLLTQHVLMGDARNSSTEAT